uniref:serine C-palmitoyltransferase n=1 Tax=Timema cristinae TaxID=61476 RepID=A0A7R9CA94_TIMCR|nr:unnamed protein product [Timema cristinae]
MAENGVIKSRRLKGKHILNEVNGKDSDFSNHVKNGNFRHKSKPPSMRKQLGIKRAFWAATICYLVLFPLLFLHLLKKFLFGERSSRDTRIQQGVVSINPPVKKEDQGFTRGKESFENAPFFTAILTYLGFYHLMFLGYINMLFFTPKVAREQNREGYVPLYNRFENFYMRYVYRRVRDCWNRPICSVPGAEVVLKDRITKDHGWTFEYTGTETCCLNLGSYNYMGFAENTGPCAEAAIEAIKKYGLAYCSPVREMDMKALENLARDAIVNGQPHTQSPWDKIFIVAEGVFSMEGSIVHLPEMIAIKKKYKLYLYLDEAHSVGALGPRGRGALDYYGCDPKDIDILMGTFTKSFGSAGGYLSGTKKLIDYLRVTSHASCYASAMSPPVAQQILTSLRIMSGEDGSSEGERRIQRLARNTRYFRRRLKQIGVITYGNEHSPVVPMLVYMFSKIGAVVRTLSDRKIATVGVGFPATPLMKGRIRFCLSAAHTKEQLDYALDVIEERAITLGLRYSQLPRDMTPIEYEAEDEID